MSLSGDVKNPGYFEIETGKVTLGELIHHENFGGGLREGRTLQAVIPGGSSSKVLKAGETFKLGEDEIALLDVPYDFDTLLAIGTMSGSGAIIALLILIGTVGGGLLGQPSIGLLVGLALGIIIALLIYLGERGK